MQHHSGNKFKKVIPFLLMASIQNYAPAFAQDVLPSDTNTINLPEINVVGSGDKLGENFKNTAQSVSVIDEQAIRDNGANRQLDEVLGYEAGVVSKQFGADNKTNWYKIRGFDANTTLDGTSLSNNGFFVWEQQLYGLEKIEILKGANSFNYGATDAGGTVNQVSKRPKGVEFGEINLSIGNFSNRSVSGDYNGVINDALSYRLVGLYSKGNFPLDFTSMEQYYIAPSLSWKISDNTSLTLLASALKNKEHQPMVLCQVMVL